MRKRTLLLALVPLVGFLAVSVILAVGLTRDPARLPSAMIDRPLADFRLPELHDETAFVTREDLTGTVALLNVFGSWCVACVTEHPFLMSISDDDRFELIGVNWRDTDPESKRWLARYGDPYDRIAVDHDSELAIELGVTGAPETYIVGPDGAIRYKHTGPLDQTIWDKQISPVIDRLIEEAEK